MRSHFTFATCPECQTYFDRLSLDYDEDGYGNAVLEVRPCAHPECGRLLCPCCATFECDGCGATFCMDHLVAVPDGTPRPLQCCAACAAECEPLELPTRIPPQLEIMAPSYLEVA